MSLFRGAGPSAGPASQSLSVSSSKGLDRAKARLYWLSRVSRVFGSYPEFDRFALVVPSVVRWYSCIFNIHRVLVCLSSFAVQHAVLPVHVLLAHDVSEALLRTMNAMLGVDVVRFSECKHTTHV